MPSRFLTAAIIVFWLATTGWLFYRDLEPRLWPGGPPPYTIDLTDEAQSNISTQWTIYRDEKNQGYCRTYVHHDADDTFELHGEFKLWYGNRDTRLADLHIRSMYRVTREGELRALSASLAATFPETLKLAHLKVEGRIDGKVRGGFFAPSVKVSQPIVFEQDLKPVQVTHGGSVLNPLQPLHRLPGLRKGQRWQVPLIDPLSDLANKYLKEVTGGSPLTQLRILRARVLPEAQVLRWGPRQEPIPCLVIEYQGDDTSARTWVREADGMVLRQEMTQGNEHIIMIRD